MPRADLMALTPDDLATLTNRGTVKRAQKELDAAEVTFEILEQDRGDLVFQWSDGITCRFPHGKTVHDAVCSSGLSGISRHVVRSVLAYQRVEHQRAGQGLERSQPEHESREGASREGEAPAEPPAESPSSMNLPPSHGSAGAPPSRRLPSQPLPSQLGPSLSVPQAAAAVWDPGSITDDELVSHFRKGPINQARKRFEQGVLVELTRGAKPVARFLDDGCTVRFLVPNDLRYVSADCAESLWSAWVPMAVWSFRELPVDRLAGLLCLQQAELPIPQVPLSNLDELLAELLRDGFSGAAETWSQRLSRLEQALRNEGLVWPAELAVDLLHQCEMYHQHDARFEPRSVVHLVGELIARTRAIRSGTRATPQPLIRGTKSDRPSEIAGGRMVGVGLGVRPGKRHATISAYLQDTDSGSVVAVERTFADPDPQSGSSPRSYSDLAVTILMRGVSLANLASSQLLLKSAKRTPSGQLILPRSASSVAVHPQSYQWEQLKPPFAAESFAQLLARFETLPPSCLRPRRRTENLHVVAVEGADEVEFDVAHQKLTARIRDSQGNFAELVHPFHTRARDGFNDLAEVLEKRGSQVRFVCGHVRTIGRTLEIQPIAVILDDGQRRIGIQPWLPNKLQTTDGKHVLSEESLSAELAIESPVKEFLNRVEDELSDLVLTGLMHSQLSTWAELIRLEQQLGFVRLTAPLAALAESLGSRSNTLHWNADPAIRQAKELCLLSRLAWE